MKSERSTHHSGNWDKSAGRNASTAIGGCEIRRIASFDAIGPGEWRRLFSKSPDNTIFQGYSWLTAWWDTFAVDNWELLLLGAYQAGNLVGAAPLYVEYSDRSSQSGSVVRFVGDEHADYAGFLIDPSTTTAIDALIDYLVEQVSEWSRVEFNQVPALSGLTKNLLARRPAPYRRLKRKWRTPCPRLTINDNPEVVERIFQKKSIRRNRAKLARIGQINVDHFRSEAKISPLLNDFFSQHVARWSQTGYPSLFENEANRNFYRRLVLALCEDDELVFTVLRTGNKNVAYHFGLLSGEDFLWYKPSFDIQLSSCSPGEVLLRELLVMVRDEKFRAFDFTRGNEAFKARFSNDIRYNETIWWYRSQLEALRAEAERARRVIKRRVFKQAATLVTGRG